MKKIIIAICCLVFLFAGFLIVNTMLLKPVRLDVKAAPPDKIDGPAAAKRLSRAVQIPTISHQDKSKFDKAPFLKFHEMLEQSYPAVHKNLERIIINDYSLLYKWQGRDPKLNPIVLMAHIDVVPVEPGTSDKWSFGPFSGEIQEGFVWGRGTLDMKSTLMSVMEAVEYLASNGFKPGRTVYLAFGHDEEIGGREGAAQIAAHLKANGVKVAFTLDEGMAILDKDLSPSKKQVGIIGLAEKGYVTLELKAKGKGGHSSMPPVKTTVGALARAVYNLENNQMPATLDGPSGLFFDYIASDLPFLQRLLFANRSLFEPLIIKQLEKIHTTNAMIRTTTAPTIIKAGIKENVLPSRAQALVNFRILPGDTADDVVAHAQKVINDPSVEISVYKGRKTYPSPVSSVDSEGFKAIQSAVIQVFPNTSVAPGLVIAGTDTKHYTEISDNNYRFFPLILKPGDPARIHGTNERISVDNYQKAILFHIQFIRHAAG